MKTYWIVLPDCISFKKHRAFFIKGGPNPGPQDRVPETRAPAKFYVFTVCGITSFLLTTSSMTTSVCWTWRHGPRKSSN